MILHSNLSKVKNKTLKTCLQGQHRNSLGEFSNTSYGQFGAARIDVGFQNISVLSVKKLKLLLILKFTLNRTAILWKQFVPLRVRMML